VELHGYAVATLLERAFIREPPFGVTVGVVCLMVALVCVLVALCPMVWGTLATVGLLVGYSWLNVWLFVDRGTWLHLASPSVGAALATVAVLTERGLTEEREKRRMRGLLQRYVSPQVAEYILKNPEKCFLGGEEVVATVLFSDIRGFTSMSEKLKPREVVERLNEYLQAMTDVVFIHNGTVDKYVGDAIMAIFGAPVPCDSDAEHALQAVKTALDMEAALLELHRQWRAQEQEPIEIGIGINTGEMIVGNIGARDRLDYTVIGDSVNLASRVEGLAKDLPGRILITESTYELVKDKIAVGQPLTRGVKGKEETTVVYELLGLREEATKAEC
jgi:adenylate cyclase